jgi:predicted transcriptional regulator
MSADIHDIADQRPHLMVAASDGAHVIPHALIRSVIAGDKPSAILSEPVVQRIIEEWFEQITQ